MEPPPRFLMLVRDLALPGDFTVGDADEDIDEVCDGDNVDDDNDEGDEELVLVVLPVRRCTAKVFF